ncbi:MAG TPA: protein kinase [Pyrinomonadaceae bacterium]
MPRLAPDSILSHYKIKELIAVGGMGEVYRAVDLQLGRVVALKTILDLQAGNPRMNHRFIREARAASILTHPSICTIYEIGRDGDLTFITMQYVAGQTIQERLSAGPIPVELALGYAMDIADALDEAHRHGVIHRDIKPSNVIINERGVAVVLDFGLATQVSFAGTMIEELSTLPNLTSTAALVGTMPYMSPEQVSGETLDERSDIFSFGVTLYEMLSGVRPFDGPTKIDLLHAILHDEPKPLTEVRPELRPQLTSVVDKALKKNPSERYQSAAEFKQELLIHIQEAGYVVARAPSASASGRLITPAPDASGWSWRQFKSLSSGALITSFVGAVLVIFAGILWWLAHVGADKPPIPHYVQVVNWKSEPGESASDAVFSPDGRMIAFSSNRGKYRDIWIKQTTMGDPSQVTKGEWNSWNPIWSPDNQQIAFLSRRGDQTGIWRMPAFGGTPTLIMAPVSGALRLKRWSKDGRRIYYELVPNLFALDVVSGQATQVTKFESSESSNPPSFSLSLNEDRIAYTERKNKQVDIWVMPKNGGSPVRVTNDSAEDRNPVWHPDGKRIIYSSVRDGTYQLCIAYLDGRAPLQITSGEGDKIALEISDNGTEILYYAAKEESDIWRVNVETAAESAFTSDPGTELWPDLSPDGKEVVYQSVDDPAQGAKLKNSLILARAVKNGEAVQLTAGGINPTWSPDSSRVAFLRSSGEVRNIWTVKGTGEEEKQLTTHGCDIDWSTLPYNRVEGKFFSWSPDGTRIICHFQEGDKSNLSVVGADDAKENVISSSSDSLIFSPVWSLDGGYVAYVSQSKSKPESGNSTWSIKLLDLTTNREETIFQKDSALRLLGWSNGGNDLVVINVKGADHLTVRAADVNLILVSKRDGSREVAQFSAAYSRNILLSPNGSAVAFASHQDGNDNLWLISTKGGSARKITSNSDPRLYFSNMAFSPDGKTIYFGKQSRSSVISMIDNFK